MRLIDILKEQKEMKLSGQLYEVTQVDMAYNSNKIEGSTLTLNQTRLLYTDDIIEGRGGAKFNDFIEMKNHFRLFDFMLDTADEPLTEDLIKRYHRILKEGTEDAQKSWFAVGDYKKEPNVVGGMPTTSPDDVPKSMSDLLNGYTNEPKTIEDIVGFHARFESIHPFQDGNGRVGRIIMFKECLRNNITPVVVPDSRKRSYYNGLSEYTDNPKKLNRTVAQFQKRYDKTVQSLVSGMLSENTAVHKEMEMNGNGTESETSGKTVRVKGHPWKGGYRKEYYRSPPKRKQKA